MHQDHIPYAGATQARRVRSAISTLQGLLTGICMDERVETEEIAYLRGWIDEHRELASVHPFNEIFPLLRASLATGKIDEEVRADVDWLCRQIASNGEYDDFVAHELRLLQGIIGGIAADGVITMDELHTLDEWMEEREHLAALWPFTEVHALLSNARSEGQLSEETHARLLAYFSDFTRTGDHRAVTTAFAETLSGVCAVGVEITLRGKRVAFTGASSRATRQQIETLLRAAGAIPVQVDEYLDYLFVGAEGNPCWHFACYGRKVELAMTFRRAGRAVLIVHESDLWDALADAGVELDGAGGGVSVGAPGLPMLLEPHLPGLTERGWHVVASSHACAVHARFKNGKPRANPAAEVEYDGQYDDRGCPVASTGSRLPYLVRSKNLQGRRVGDASKAVAMFLEQIAALEP